MRQFQRTGSANPPRSVFDLSYEKKLTCDMGELIPVMCDEVVPGDVFKIGNEVVVRFQPLVAPMMHEVNVYIHYFFVPYRILWDGWEDFITGGPDGDDASEPPRWTPSAGYYGEGSLWDYLGMPVNVIPTGALPLSFPQYAYNKIFNDYYRDENLWPEENLYSDSLKNRSWEKDYFTSALPWQQRGTAPALPISGTTMAEWDDTNFVNADPGGASAVKTRDVASTPKLYVSGATNLQNLINFFGSNTVDLSSATTFNVADLRLAFQIQRWLERNARAGARYIESMKAHFGVSPRDERLQRPEYIGGTKQSCVVSEVLQTSSTDATSPQGNLAGHGISVARQYVTKYRAEEYGLIMGIMSVMPRTAYQQGIDRQWLRRTRYDFYWPEFANLSEQAIEMAELYATAVESENTSIFGYQGRYDEMRVKRNMVCGMMRNTLDYWHLGRIFSSAPSLNYSFVKCLPDKRPFAVQDEDCMIVNIGNIVHAVRPLPIMSNPGLIDH